MLFQRCFANVETTSINVGRFNFHFQPNINVETTLTNVDDQRCFNVDSTLMCLLGSTFFIEHVRVTASKVTLQVVFVQGILRDFLKNLLLILSEFKEINLTQSLKVTKLIFTF